MLAAPQISRPQNLLRIALTRSVIGHVLFLLAFVIAPLVQSLFVRELPAGSPFYVDLASSTPGVPPPQASEPEEQKQQQDEIKVPPKPEIKKPEKKKEPDKKDDKTKPVTNTVAKAATPPAKAKPNAPPKKKLTEAEIRKMLESGIASVGTGGSTGSGTGGGKFGLGGTGTGPMTELDTYSAYVTKVMYEAWDQPSELSDPGINAVVKIRVERNGTITTRTMSNPSGNSVMDASVMRAVKDVSRLRPLPPSYDGTYLDIPITFVLDTVL